MACEGRGLNPLLRYLIPRSGRSRRSRHLALNLLVHTHTHRFACMDHTDRDIESSILASVQQAKQMNHHHHQCLTRWKGSSMELEQASRHTHRMAIRLSVAIRYYYDWYTYQMLAHTLIHHRLVYSLLSLLCQYMNTVILFDFE